MKVYVVITFDTQSSAKEGHIDSIFFNRQAAESKLDKVVRRERQHYKWFCGTVRCMGIKDSTRYISRFSQKCLKKLIEGGYDK